MTSALEIKDLHVNVEGKEILHGVNISVRQGEIHAIMGPNGSGKSTLAQSVMGHPKYEVTKGDVLLDGEKILPLKPDERSRKGLFLAFQYPVEISGVNLFTFLRSCYNAQKGIAQTARVGQETISILKFRQLLLERLKLLNMDESFVNRPVNEGFSGGEKKRCEILQLAILMPKFAMMDETDSGLDIDALRVVADGINTLAGPDLGIFLITHYNRILKYIKPHFVHVMVDGRIVLSGGEELAQKLEEKGYSWVREETPVIQ